MYENIKDLIYDFKISLCIFPFFVMIWFNSENRDNLLDKIFPINFMKNTLTGFQKPESEEVDGSYIMKLDHIDDNDYPAVSIVTPTCNRRHVFSMAVRNFYEFAYPPDKLEWIIVSNNKEDSIESMLPPVEHRESYRIKYTECDENSSYGKMLNIGVENASNELVMVMEDDYFFYQNGLNLIVNEYLNSKKAIIGCTTLGIFDINRYISVISGNKDASDYLQSVNLGSVIFSKSFWQNGKFGINEGTELEEMISSRFAEYSEYSWNDKFVGLSYSKNENKWIVPDNQEANGCHYKFSKKVYEFLVSLDPKEPDAEPEPEEEEEEEAGDFDLFD